MRNFFLIFNANLQKSYVWSKLFDQIYKILNTNKQKHTHLAGVHDWALLVEGYWMVDSHGEVQLQDRTPGVD